MLTRYAPFRFALPNQVDVRKWGQEHSFLRCFAANALPRRCGCGAQQLPLQLNPGREIEGPMAVVILGGLITSMVLNLLVLPTLAVAFGRFEPTETVA